MISRLLYLILAHFIVSTTDLNDGLTSTPTPVIKNTWLRFRLRLQIARKRSRLQAWLRSRNRPSLILAHFIVSTTDLNDRTMSSVSKLVSELVFSTVGGLIPPRGAFSMVCLSLMVQCQYSQVIVEALISIIDICKRINGFIWFTLYPGSNSCFYEP